MTKQITASELIETLKKVPCDATIQIAFGGKLYPVHRAELTISETLLPASGGTNCITWLTLSPSPSSTLDNWN